MNRYEGVRLWNLQGIDVIKIFLVFLFYGIFGGFIFVAISTFILGPFSLVAGIIWLVCTYLISRREVLKKYD